MIFNAYLAYASKRSYVFDNYTWYREGPDTFVDSDGTTRHARMPLSAFISGPMIGGAMPNKDVPRAVSREHYLSVCPESNRTVIDTSSIQTGDVADIVAQWVKTLDAIDSPCVELASDSPVLFNFNVTGTLGVLDVFPALAESPILADLGWSPLVLQNFANNSDFFGPSSALQSGGLVTTHSPLYGLLVLHVRRGDFDSFCNNIVAKYNLTYNGFNSFPALPDRYTPPDHPGSHTTAEDALRHCHPSIPEIMKRVLAVVDASPYPNRLTRVYVMTNAKHPWLADLVTALRAARTWSVGTSKYVSQAVDMHAAQRAEVFIGNGFSSLTSNVVMLRMANEALDPSNTHFW
ncbi:hypothetical protein FB45DRAFT_981153 [Roridomyces roridus]|uniref:Uncharacterized protein n=1 Tax=Roridomyces roridus TaxID=1738132 RepID=A0AAD7FE11_9AGAR|nr:hypothetical protein FB45DRAFT_981153 [Roridomyces roridus]